MRIVHTTCAGVDVHKQHVTVCLITRDASGQRTQEVRTYRTVTKELLAMRDWLQDHGCRVVAIESTGVYWKPVYNLLEGEFEVLLVNPAHLKHVPGRKTDVKDCEWIAELLEHGLLRGSFIPPREIRDLRDLTRYRRRLVQMRASEVNRLQKILEDANIKLASVVSDVMGVSGRAILNALLSGERDPQRLAELSKGRLRGKMAELTLALEGRFRPHHARLLARIVAHIDFLDQSIAECEAEIEEMCRPFAQEIELVDTVTGVGKRAAQDMIAEIGVDMSRFPSHKHLCSWARVCPGNNKSAGKRKSGHTGKRNKWLKAILVECAHAAGRTKGTYLSAQYARFARRKGEKRAAVAVGHSILEAVYFILRDKVPYRDLGPNHFDEINKAHTVRYHIRRFESLGLRIQVQELSALA
ncbi:MAG TPA: IS110 family transposase [Anaerolineae bacterium]|nr:IS110 family transposase [Anaerolineae bacterium]